MSILFYLLLLSGAYVGAWHRGDLEPYGPLAWVSKTLKCEHSRTLNIDVSKITVYFYDFLTGFTKSFTVKEAAKGILSLKNLNKGKKFFMFVGGFKSNINKKTEASVRDAFKKVSKSYLIIIDHSDYTHERPKKLALSYELSVRHVYYIGKQLAEMLAGLHKGGISATNIHCIGHSLGSQILGHVGEKFTQATGKKISRITALDPAGPCFSNSKTEEQIRAGVADYVEVYHCNAGSLGTSSILADIDFFVNKGNAQPNCGTPLIPGIVDSSKAAKCNHKTCVTMWTASVAHPDWYTAYQCNSYNDFKAGRCFQNARTTAGFWNPGKAKGIYYFSTKEYSFN